MNSNSVSRFTLERYLAGELGEVERAAVESAVAQDEQLRAQLQALRDDEHAFAREVPYAGFRIEHERRVAARSAGGLRFLTPRVWLPSLAAALGAAAAMFLTVGPDPGDAPVTDHGTRIERVETTRSKGALVALTATVALPDGAPRAAVSEEVVPPGTRVQLAYEAGGHSHMALFGIDARGATSQYFPSTGEAMAPLPAGARGALPFSLTLDATPGPERFVAVFADGPQPLAAVRAALQGGGPLPEGVSQASFWLQRN